MIRKFMRMLWMFFLVMLLNQEGAIKVKPLEASTQKWSENAGRAAESFAVEAEAAADAWVKNTAAATDTFGSAITAPGIKERFRRGVQAAGATKFARKIRDVGRDRFAPGVAAASSDYRDGASPYYATLAALTLSSRKPRGDPANYRRVEEVGKALNAKRLAMLGSTGISFPGA